MNAVVECVPNISEGRDRELIDRVVHGEKWTDVRCSALSQTSTTTARSSRWPANLRPSQRPLTLER